MNSFSILSLPLEFETGIIFERNNFIKNFRNFLKTLTWGELANTTVKLQPTLNTLAEVITLTILFAGVFSLLAGMSTL